MESYTKEDLDKVLGSLSAMELVALTRKLEAQWGVKAEPVAVQAPPSPPDQNKLEVQTEFTVVLSSVPADKKMATIKVVRDLTGLGLKESKDLVEAAPKTLKESVSKEEAENFKNKLTEAGAVVEVK